MGPAYLRRFTDNRVGWEGTSDVGDLVQVQGNGTVQARIAINLTTGEVVHPVPGINIKRWQAEILGEVDLYERRREEQQNRPLDLSEWDFGGSLRGIPKEKS